MKRKPANGASATAGLRYWARITRQRDGGYLVVFPDLPGCLTEGDTVEESLCNAREALSGWLWVAIKHGQDAPPPTVRRGRSYRQVAPDLDVVVPLLVLWERKKRHLTQTQMAQMLGVTQQAYRKLEIPGKSNPTLKTLTRLCLVLGLSLELQAA